MLEVTVSWNQPNHIIYKERDAILRSPSWKLSSPQLHLEILSMKITNTIADKGKPWQTGAWLCAEYTDTALTLVTRTGWIIATTLVPQLPTVTPTGLPRGQGRNRSPSCCCSNILNMFNNAMQVAFLLRVWECASLKTGKWPVSLCIHAMDQCICIQKEHVVFTKSLASSSLWW